jgi:hypothetical protein
MIGVGAIGVPNAEVVHDKTENDITHVVSPQTGGQGTWGVSVGAEELDQLVVGKAAGLG